MIKNIFILASLFTLSACMVKAPDDGSNLGAPTTSDKIDAAISNAKSGVTQDQAFHVGDTGIIQILDNIATSTFVSETHEWDVTKIDSKTIYCTEHVVETGATTNYALARTTALSFTKVPEKVPGTKKSLKNILIDAGKKLASFFPLFPSSGPNQIAKNVAKAFGKIEIEDTRAIGSEESQNRVKDFEKSVHSKLLTDLDQKVNGPAMTVMDVSASPSTTPSPVASASPSPSPSAAPSPTTSPGDASAPTPTSTSQFYGLTILKHKVTTQNCSQLPGCTVDATQIKFVEMRKFSSGNQARLNWTYEVTNQVPGLFMTLSECYATIVVQNGNQYPLTECAQVGNFKFGSGTASN